MRRISALKALIRGLGVLALAMAMMAPGQAVEAQSPINLSLFPPIQLTGEDESVKGVRLSLVYGKNANMTGLDWSFIANHTTGDFKGVQLGLAGYNEGAFTGWGAGAVNIAKGEFYGLQTGLFGQVNNGRGVQFNTINQATGNFNGLQLAIVNYAQSINGVQIGLINIIKEGGQFPVFPIVNWGK